eukprot:scaffold114719_cov41-Tisochrysis_lutea.AAC.2
MTAQGRRLLCSAYLHAMDPQPAAKRHHAEQSRGHVRPAPACPLVRASRRAQPYCSVQPAQRPDEAARAPQRMEECAASWARSGRPAS